MTHGSRSIFSVAASCWSSLETALTLSPRFVVTVTADTLSLVVLGSCVVSGLCAAVCCCSVLCCFAALPSAMSSATSRLGAAGSGVLLLCVVGDVAIGTSVIAGVGVSRFLAETGSSSGCCVCVSAVAAACFCVLVLCVGKTTKPVGVGVVIGVELMMCIICLLNLSVIACLLIVLALTICWDMPRMFSFVEVSLPSQMARQNRALILGLCFAVGYM